MASRSGTKDLEAAVKTDSTIDLNPFISTACALVDYVDTCDTGNLLTSALLKEIEIALAAHFYSQRDQLYSANKTGDASAKYQTGVQGAGSLDVNDFGRRAMLLDVTGCLANLNEQAKTGKRTAAFNWLGKPESEQLAYEDRD